MPTIRVGTRGSALALTQTNQVVDALRQANPAVSFETAVIRTTGDARQTIPFAAVGTKGMFVKELEEALLAGDIQLAVHSMKDMPGELPAGLILGAVPRREDPRDALVSDGRTLGELPDGAVVGTSSLRRQALVRAARPSLRVEELRGNLDTRLRKLDDGQYDGIVLACAGLERMGWSSRVVERLSTHVFVPAPGQGALALEARADDHATLAALEPLHDAPTAAAVEAERAFQAALGAGCTVPAGAYASIEDGRMQLVALVASPDGAEVLREQASGAPERAEELGRQVASALLARGAARWIG